MLSLEQQKKFICCFNQHALSVLRKCQQKKVENVDNWIRALKGILIYSNEALRSVDSGECEKTMYLLLQIWIKYNYYGKKRRYVANVVCCMLFLLRRRKYDHAFLKESTSQLYVDILSMSKEPRCQFPLECAFFNYMKNNGSIDIPKGDLLESE